MFVNWARRPKRGNEGVAAGRRDDSAGAGGSVRPVLPPGGAQTSGRSNPVAGFAPSRPPAEVMAAAAAARGGLPRPAIGVGIGVPRPGGLSSGVPRPAIGVGIGVPRPGGGPIRGAGTRAASTAVSRGAAPRPYYPSADPGRLGSRSAAAGGADATVR